MTHRAVYTDRIDRSHTPGGGEERELEDFFNDADAAKTASNSYV
jgi:hypothetical protein